MCVCIYIYIYTLFQVLFLYRLLQNIEGSFLCCTVGQCCLSILCIAVCICQSQNPSLSPSCSPPLATINLFSGHFVGRIKGAKYRFDLQYLTWDFS